MVFYALIIFSETNLSIEQAETNQGLNCEALRNVRVTWEDLFAIDCLNVMSMKRQIKDLAHSFNKNQQTLSINVIKFKSISD